MTLAKVKPALPSIPPAVNKPFVPQTINKPQLPQVPIQKSDSVEV